MVSRPAAITVLLAAGALSACAGTGTPGGVADTASATPAAETGSYIRRALQQPNPFLKTYPFSTLQGTGTIDAPATALGQLNTAVTIVTPH